MERFEGKQENDDVIILTNKHHDKARLRYASGVYGAISLQVRLKICLLDVVQIIKICEIYRDLQLAA